ncbi:MAG: hydantoinase B/oxoprolinase family protein [bacterium]
MTNIGPIELEIFKNLFASLCEEMGVLLGRTAFSPNIKERKDFSCALFDPQARLVAQAAHIPVHLGSMPLSVKAAIAAFPRMKPGDAVILNDPYRGGTHLPDITVVNPVFVPGVKIPVFYVANRAHHADVGGRSPGSMALASHLEEEGVVIPPTLLQKKGRWNFIFLNAFLKEVRRPDEREADLNAQVSANRLGERRLRDLASQYGLTKILKAMAAYRLYEEKITRQALNRVKAGDYFFEDFLDDDGLGSGPISIRVKIKIRRSGITIDFRDSSPQVKGPLNATRSITLSSVAYVFRCLVNALTGEDCLSLKPFTLLTRKGTVGDARYPAPVAAGNVETSQRLVDVLLGALSQALPDVIPAASQGTMNNVAFGSEKFTYYETLAGGSGATPQANGANAIHTHMTNTLNTPIEALETSLPLRVHEYRIRRNSGGVGKHAGGAGLVRELEFLTETQVSLLTDRRILNPWGLRGGKPGKTGANWQVTSEGKQKLPGKCELTLKKGERLRIETPGGGGWGRK